MRFQLISDIHHEFLRGGIYTKIVPKCSTLVLAGDIGNPLQSNYGMFLRKLAYDFEHIILIHGNHEYYATNYNVSVQKTREICEEINAFKPTANAIKGKIHFLHNSHVDIRGVRFIGTTLWTKLDPEVPLIGDRNIKDFSIDWYNRMHHECCEYLESAIRDIPVGKQTVIVSHHLPSFSLIAPKYNKYGMINQWFASNSDQLIEMAAVKGIKSWVYGHTHDCCETNIHGINMVCNPVGYPGEKEIQVSEDGDTTIVVEV